MTPTTKCGWFTALFFGFAVSGMAAKAQSQAPAWPDRSVKFILPFGAGSATDIAARLLAERLTVKWGKPVVIENRPGGDGLVAINAFITANDDHVLLYASSASFMAHPYTQEKLPYELERDFAPIARVCDTVLSVGVPAASEFRMVADFVTKSRAEPAKYHAAGAAGVPEFVLGAFLKNENLDVTKVPYRDVVQAGRDLGESRIHFLLSSYAVVRPLIEADKVRVLAAGGRKRAAVAPNVPAVMETGYPGLLTETTSGLYGPKAMPLNLRERVAADVIAAASDPVAVERIVSSGQDMNTGGPAELTATLKQQADAIASVAKVLGMERKR